MWKVCWGITCPHFLNLARRFSFHLQVNVSENSSWGNICLTHSCPGQLKFPNKPNLSKRESYEKNSPLRLSGQHFFSIEFKEHLFLSFALVPNAPPAAACAGDSRSYLRFSFPCLVAPTSLRTTAPRIVGCRLVGYRRTFFSFVDGARSMRKVCWVMTCPHF